MRQCARIAWVGLLFIADLCLVAAQEAVRLPEVPTIYDTLLHHNTLSILFDRNLNTYNWAGRLLVDTSAAQNRIAVNTQYLSNIIVTEPGASSGLRLRSDQINLGVLLARPLTTDYDIVTQWSSLVSTDNRGVGLSNASSHSILAGVSAAPATWFTVTPMAGYRWDDQAGMHDRGLIMNLAGTVRDIDLEGYQMAGALQYHRDMLDPRTLETDFAHGGVQRIFSGRTRDSLDIGLSKTRREFYSLADSTIESRIDNLLSFANMLDYDLGANVVTSLFIAVANRTLDKNLRPFGTAPPQQPLFNTQVNEFHLDTYIQAAYLDDASRTSGSIRLFHSERDETHTLDPVTDSSPAIQAQWNDRNRQEKSKDNIARRTALTGMFDIPLSLSDRLAIAAWASILRYDTPDTDNVEDRDELLVTGSVATSHRISRYLEIGVSLDGSFSHLVYLLKERSANNNINRVIRLSPKVLVRPLGVLTSLNAFEVLANYTVYDYENSLGNVRSFSYRQFGWMDSTVVPLNDRICLDFFAYLKLYERGQLNWNEFTERLENSSVDKTYALQVRFTPYEWSVFAVGVRYFSQTRYTYGEQGKVLDSFLNSIGPTCWIQYELAQRTRLSFRGWYELRKQPDGTSRTLGSMTLNLLISL